MVNDLRRLIDKVFYMVPVKYWNAAAAVAIGALLLGIGNTVLNPAVPDGTHGPAGFTKSPAPLLVEKGKISVPDTISRGNVFRKQRKNFVVPPPPAPKPAPVVTKEIIPVEFKLLGTIITAPARIAIMNATRKKPKKKEPPKIHLSGALAQAAREKKAAKPARPKSAEPQSFHEGDNVFDYILERVYQDRIELVSLEDGARSVVYMEIEGIKAPAPPPRKEKQPLKKEAAKPIKVSGAKTKTTDPSRSSAMGAQAENK